MNSDNIWVEKIREGNLDALSGLYEKYFQTLVFFAKSLCKSEQLAEDIVQDCFLKFWDYRKKLPLSLHAKAYLFSMVYNLWINHQKHQKLVIQVENKLKTESADDYLEQDNSVYDKSKLFEELKKLPERCRLIFILFHLKGLSHKEIACSLNVSPKTVEVQVRKAKLILREELKKKQ